MAYQYSLINCNKSATLAQDASKRGTVWRGGTHMGNLYILPNFSVNLKLLLKNKINLLIKKPANQPTCREAPGTKGVVSGVLWNFPPEVEGTSA